MQLRNGAHGYGVVTRFLHWLTVAAILGIIADGETGDPDADATAEPGPDVPIDRTGDRP